jgi:hypothetical protein
MTVATMPQREERESYQQGSVASRSMYRRKELGVVATRKTIATALAGHYYGNRLDRVPATLAGKP